MLKTSKSTYSIVSNLAPQPPVTSTMYVPKAQWDNGTWKTANGYAANGTKTVVEGGVTYQYVITVGTAVFTKYRARAVGSATPRFGYGPGPAANWASYTYLGYTEYTWYGASFPVWGVSSLRDTQAQAEAEADANLLALYADTITNPAGGTKGGVTVPTYATGKYLGYNYIFYSQTYGWDLAGYYQNLSHFDAKGCAQAGGTVAVSSYQATVTKSAIATEFKVNVTTTVG